jgi:predicted O-methyltransferase YrrM
MGRSIVESDAVEGFVCDVMCPESDVARRLRKETAALGPESGMQIGPDQARLLALLARLVGARRAIEVGTFTGMSALAVASALPKDGKLVCCDVSEEWTAIARRAWKDAGVADRIDLRIAPATETLAALRRAGGDGTYDLAFIDADKEQYAAYYEACLALLRPGGLIAIDNALWGGRVCDPAQKDADTSAIRALDLFVRDDPRVEQCMLTVGDGVLLARKR